MASRERSEPRESGTGRTVPVWLQLHWRRQMPPDPRLGEITPDQMRQYMKSSGFGHRVYPQRQDVEAFVGPKDLHGTELLMLFYNQPACLSYLVYLSEVMVTLCGWEDRPESEIVTDILRLPNVAKKG